MLMIWPCISTYGVALLWWMSSCGCWFVKITQVMNRSEGNDEEDSPRIQNRLRPNHNPWIPEHVRSRYTVPRVLLHDCSSSHGMLVHLHKTSRVYQLQHSFLFLGHCPHCHVSQTRKQRLSMKGEGYAHIYIYIWDHKSRRRNGLWGRSLGHMGF